MDKKKRERMLHFFKKPPGFKKKKTKGGEGRRVGIRSYMDPTRKMDVNKRPGATTPR